MYKMPAAMTMMDRLSPIAIRASAAEPYIMAPRPRDPSHFPCPGKEAEYDRMIEDLGGVDLCLGGLGINGHVAFNEPPEREIPADEFAALGTRVLSISRETRTINAYGYRRGDLQGMPEICITVGMRQILSSKKIYIALNRPWQNGPFKRALFGPETSRIPASLLRRCKDLTWCGIDEALIDVL